MNLAYVVFPEVIPGQALVNVTGEVFLSRSKSPKTRTKKRFAASDAGHWIPGQNGIGTTWKNETEAPTFSTTR